MDNRLLRLATFSTFPIEISAFAVNLADSGFQYDGCGNSVTCCVCRLTFSGWQNEQELYSEHKSISPKCPTMCSNIFEQSNDLNIEKLIERKIDLPTNQKDMERKNDQQLSDRESTRLSVLSPQTLNSISKSKSTENMAPAHTNVPSDTLFEVPTNNEEKRQLLKKLGISTEKPKYSAQAILTVRISTFQNWHRIQSPEGMAKAGFFYTGMNDLVRCFQCGGGLTNWEPEDDPWVEHAHWFPECTFLRHCKGNEFVRMVQEMVQEHDVQVMNENIPRNPDGNNISEGTDPMKSAAVLSILDMNYTTDIVRRAIGIWNNKTNFKTFTAADLLDIVFDIENETTMEVNSYHYNIQKQTEQNRTEERCENLSSATQQSLKTEVTNLQEENRHLREKTLCKVCMDESVSHVFLPCGHMCTCEQCAPAMRFCPICRSVIGATIRVHLV